MLMRAFSQVVALFEKSDRRDLIRILAEHDAGRQRRDPESLFGMQEVAEYYEQKAKHRT